MKRCILFFTLMLTISAGASALEIREGRIKLIINEQTARFSCYYLSDIAKNVYTPLIYDQEPRTTFATLSVDGKTYRLGESAEYRFTVGRSSSGAFIEYRSSFCVIRQSFGFVKSLESTLADGISITFDIENVSEKDIAVGLRFLADTYLGEKSGRHFAVGALVKLTGEFSLSASFTENRVVSPGDSGVSLAVSLGGSGITVPDRVLMANWKRLYDSAWSFDAVSSRDFNLYPYSINDSALALFYEPLKVRRGGSRSIPIVMGVDTSSGFSLSGTATATPADSAFKTGVLTSPQGNNPSISVQTDLIAIRDLVAALDKKLASGASITDEELAIYRKIIEQLKLRKAGY